MAQPADFVASRSYWIIIKHRNYENLREDTDGWSTFQNIDAVDQDAQNAKAGFISLGANACDIQILENQSFKELSTFFRGINRGCTQNWENGRQKTLVFCYYAGHGIMDNTVFAVCNGGPLKSKYCYPLQQTLTAIA